MPVMLLDHAGVGMPEILGRHQSGTPAITASEAQVWRKAWNETRGLILACAQAACMGLDCSDLSQRLPSACRNTRVE